MNNEATSSAAASQPPRDEDGPQAAPTAAELAERRKKNRQMFNRKRGDLLDDLLRNLDILIYAELSTIYYMDCAFLRFILRAFVQFMFLTPKPAMFPEHPADKPVIGALVLSNALCIFLHAWYNAPSAGEATRGYLHGGIAMDLIGQKGPSSKMHLLALDILVIILQLIHLAANMVRKKMKTIAPPSATTTSDSNAQQTPNATSTQDVDSEERGVHRAETQARQQDIEMQNLNPETGASISNNLHAAPEVPSSSDTLNTDPSPRTDAHIFDAFNSGQIVIADLDLWKSIKDQVRLVRSAGTGSAESISGQQRTLRAEIAGRMLRLSIGTDALRRAI